MDKTKRVKPKGWGDRASTWMTEIEIARSTPAVVRFVARRDSDSGYTASAIGPSIHTEADNLPDLRRAAAEAVRCHFGRHIPFLIEICDE